MTVHTTSVYFFNIFKRWTERQNTGAAGILYKITSKSLWESVIYITIGPLLSVEAVTYDDYASSETAPDNTGHKPTLLILGTLHASCVLVYQLSHSTYRAVSL